GFCDACFTGSYPIEVPVDLRKGVLESSDLPDPSAHGMAQGPGLFADPMLPADDARRGAS
ncbi:MAG TPA: hypothetical protein VGM93_04110, partial [Acidimicrobiales bacterium]